MEKTIKSPQHIGYSEGRKASSEIAMVIILTSMSMLFATLMLGYAVYRVSSAMWPPMGFDRVSLVEPLVSTFIIAISSVFYFKFEKTNKSLYYYFCLVTGLAFVVSQFNLWSQLKAQGVFSHSGTFGSMIYGFTWIHLGHMVLAILLLLWLMPSVLKNQFNEKIEIRIKNVGKFWHFLGVIWLIMLLTLFVI